MTKKEIEADIVVSRFQLNGLNPRSPHYKDLKRHIKKLERRLANGIYDK